MIDTGNILWTEFHTEYDPDIVLRHWIGLAEFDQPECYLSVTEINPENFRVDISAYSWRLRVSGFPTSDMAMNWADR